MRDMLLYSRINWPGIFLIVLIVVVWEIWAQIADSFYFPSASAVAATIVDDHAALLAATMDTLRRAAIGFAIALVTMLPLGIVLGRIRLSAKARSSGTAGLR